MPLFGPPNIEKLREKGDVGGLIKALGYDHDPTIPTRAAAALADIGTDVAITALIAALNHSSAEVRMEAAKGLGRLESDAGVKALAAALKHSNADVRRAAFRGLGRKGNRAAVEPLIEVVMDRCEQTSVRIKAMEALGGIGAAATEALVKVVQKGGVPDPVLAGRTVVKQHMDHSAGVHLYHPGLHEEKLNLARSLHRVFTRIGKQAIEPLAAALRSGKYNTWDDYSHGNAGELIEALQSIGKPAAAGLAGLARQHESEFVRARAIRALGELPDDRAEETVIVALKGDRSPGVREAAARALGRFGDARAIEALVAAARGDPWEKHTVGRYADGRAMGSTHPVRDAARKALVDIGGSRAKKALQAVDE